ncbi:MAG: type I secretion system permease/ATPase [Rhodospirillales bacterium]|nr:type I secretion system permease/ATPase [Rhodospirillales bacterium]
MKDHADLLRTTWRQSAAGIGFAAFLGLFINILHLMVPMFAIQVYDRVMGSRSLETLALLVILVLCGLVYLAVLEFIRARVFMIVGERVARRLSAPTLEAAVAETLRSRSPVAANGMRDLQELRQFLSGGPVSLPIDAAFAPVFLMALILLHPAYAVVASGGAVLMIVMGLATEFLARRPAARANDAALKSHAEVGAAIRNAEVIEAMGMRAAIVRRWSVGQNRALALVGIGNQAAKALAAASRSTRMALQVAMLATGATLVVDHAVSSGSMMAASFITARLLHPFDALIDGWKQWANALCALRRLRTLLADGSAGRNREPVMATSGTLTVDNVTFMPPGSERPVLRSLRFALEEGEVLGIVGPSGAGKSTLARLLVGIWRPTTGGIYLDGHDVYTWERGSFGTQVGYLPQNTVLLDGTVRENIARFAEADPAEVIDAAKRADVHDLIGRLPQGYETKVGESGFALSGGQRQRIALARALFGAPRLLVLDEPNAHVDGTGEQALMQAIRGAKKSGTTVVVVAHRMAVMAVADKILVLRDGAVDQWGSRDTVMRTLVARAAPAQGGDAKVTRLPVVRAQVRP